VLTPNIFYRTTKPPAFEFEPDFPSERAVNRFRELTGPFTPDAMVRAGLGLHRLPRHAASRTPVAGGPAAGVFSTAGNLVFVGDR
jgi:hypothetical protein